MQFSSWNAININYIYKFIFFFIIDSCNTYPESILDGRSEMWHQVKGRGIMVMSLIKSKGIKKIYIIIFLMKFQ